MWHFNLTCQISANLYADLANGEKAIFADQGDRRIKSPGVSPAFSRDNHDANENGTYPSRFQNKFAMISTHLVCVMWPNYPGANAVGSGFRVQREKGKVIRSRSP